MNQNQILSAILISFFVAIAGLLVTNSFIAKPEDRQEEVVQVRSFESSFSQEAIDYLNDPKTIIYQVDTLIDPTTEDGEVDTNDESEAGDDTNFVNPDQEPDQDQE